MIDATIELVDCDIKLQFSVILESDKKKVLTEGIEKFDHWPCNECLSVPTHRFVYLRVCKCKTLALNIISLAVKMYFPHIELKYISAFVASPLCYPKIQYPFILGIKKINLQGGWQVSTDADKAEMSSGTLQPPELYLEWCRSYLHIIHTDCLFNDQDLARSP